MAEFTNIDLRKARDAQKLTRWQAGAAIGVSDSTIERWESGETVPTPEDIDQLEKLYKQPGLWHAWMRSHYDSYRSRYPESLDVTTALAIVNVRHQLMDVLNMQDRAERDALPDNRLDNDRLKADYIREAKEAVAALAAMLANIEAATKE